jgi:hypothetical protein
MKDSGHLTHGLLIRALDDELPAPEASAAEKHLSACAACQREYEALRSLSVRISALISSADLPSGEDFRAALAARLDYCGDSTMPADGRSSWLRFAISGIAAAAALVFALFISHARYRTPSANHMLTSASNGTIEVDGETFILLPYSNPDLPVATPRIVEMHVPADSLAEAGVLFEPVSTQVDPDGGTVLADVLVGLDGQPVGIHVLGAP